ncbi:hypothetical protein [Halomonas cupida]|uniref:hypothetical protein n=1 Tax=Halomonas cupida TaxID=44933 RepID=UPI001161299B|nr:hypothetical protein [Halomonas cupida]
MAAQGRAAVGLMADAGPHHTSRSAHLRQWGADDNQIDQDELFDCHVNKAAPAPGSDVKRCIAHPARCRKDFGGQTKRPTMRCQGKMGRHEDDGSWSQNEIISPSAGIET